MQNGCMSSNVIKRANREKIAPAEGYYCYTPKGRRTGPDACFLLLDYARAWAKANSGSVIYLKEGENTVFDDKSMTIRSDKRI